MVTFMVTAIDLSFIPVNSAVESRSGKTKQKKRMKMPQMGKGGTPLCCFVDGCWTKILASLSLTGYIILGSEIIVVVKYGLS